MTGRILNSGACFDWFDFDTQSHRHVLKLERAASVSTRPPRIPDCPTPTQRQKDLSIVLVDVSWLAIPTSVLITGRLSCCCHCCFCYCCCHCYCYCSVGKLGLIWLSFFKIWSSTCCCHCYCYCSVGMQSTVALRCVTQATSWTSSWLVHRQCQVQPVWQQRSGT